MEIVCFGEAMSCFFFFFFFFFFFLRTSKEGKGGFYCSMQTTIL